MAGPGVTSFTANLLALDSQAGRLIAGHDWSATSLGPIEDWPQSLKTAVGIILVSSVPIVMLWGEDGVMLYNDAYSGFAGRRHPRLLGSKVREGWPEVADFNDHVMRVGLAGGTLAYRDQELVLHRHGRPEQVWMNLDYSPVPDESGRPAGVIAIVVETTERVLAERRQAFRLQLEERLRGLADPRAVTRAASEALGVHLGALRVGYIAFERDGIHGTVSGEWCSDGVSSIAGLRYRLTDFGAELLTSYAAGRTVAIDDLATDSRSTGLEAAASHATFGAKAQVVVPLVKAGRLAATLFVHSADPRAWPEPELALVEDVAERTWAAAERARAEAALRDSEQQLRLATEAAEVGLWDTDPRSGALFWPPRVKAMFGISPEAPVSMADFYAGLHPDDRDRINAAFANSLDPAVRAVYDVEYRTIGKEDGLTRWIAAKGRGVFEDGSCVRVLGTAIDITRRKADEERLRDLNDTLERRVADALAERKLLADIIEGTDVFVQVADLDYRWLAINQAAGAEFARIFDVPVPKVGDSMLDLLADRPEERRRIRAIWGRALAGEEFSQVEAFGSADLRRYYEIRFRALRDRDGSVVGAYQFVYDVTDRVHEQARLQEAENALRQAQKMEAVGQLTGGIAHDFNNLLQSVAGSLDLIRRKPDDRERVRRWAEGGLEAAERGAKLTGQLLAFSRAQRLEARPLIVADIVAGMRDLLARTLGPQIAVMFDLDDARVPVLSDPTQLEMAVLNLAINARDAMPEGGALLIRTRPRDLTGDAELPAGRYLELLVEDTGEGMPADVAGRAFDPFFTTKEVGKGSGLGLSQVYGMARQSGGVARIESAPGQGTTVHLFLPQTERNFVAEDEPDARAASAPAPSAKVLVIDDDDDVRRFLVDSLEALGYSVHAAENGERGLAALDSMAPDVVVIDYAMPGMNGAEVARQARTRRPDLPIVFASGYSDTAAIEAVLGQGAPVLRKPFRVDELHDAVTDALAK